MPETITLEQHINLMKHGLENLYKSNGDSEYIEENGTVINWNEHIPKEWLQEVKEPVDADDAWEDYKEAVFRSTGKGKCYRDGFTEGEENQKLRHVGTKTCNESWAEYKKYWNIAGSFMADRRYKSGWEACKKSHGLDCD